MRRGLLVVLLGVALLLLAHDVRQQLFVPLPIETPRLVDVPRGARMAGLVREWRQQNILVSDRQGLYLTAFARLSGQAQRIKAGEYEFTRGMRAVDLTALLVSGRSVLHELRLVEGWTFAQALAEVRRHDAIRLTLPAEDAGAALMAALGQPGLHPEGRFHPETYRFPRGTTDVAFMKRAYDAMAAMLAEEWAARDLGLPYAKPDDALIMASIVERETSVPAERAEIAGVFVRRLQQGMRLQTDPTVIYGLGAAFDGNLRKRDLLADTPYNTYTRRGLPPTPICLPGRAAVHAALHPAPGKTLYFVSRGDGTHQFSATIAEHSAAVRKYQLRRRK